jgi:hypothetical protein
MQVGSWFTVRYGQHCLVFYLNVGIIQNPLDFLAGKLCIEQLLLGGLD